MKNAGDMLEEGLATFRGRQKLYGSTYRVHGSIMKALFPEGIILKTEDDFNRYAILVNITTKLHRYANNFAEGGHLDSAHDLGVYGFILQELTTPEVAEAPLVAVEHPVMCVCGHLRGIHRYNDSFYHECNDQACGCKRFVFNTAKEIGIG